MNFGMLNPIIVGEFQLNCIEFNLYSLFYTILATDRFVRLRTVISNEHIMQLRDLFIEDAAETWTMEDKAKFIAKYLVKPQFVNILNKNKILTQYKKFILEHNLRCNIGKELAVASNEFSSQHCKLFDNNIMTILSMVYTSFFQSCAQNNVLPVEFESFLLRCHKTVTYNTSHLTKRDEMRIISFINL